MDEFKLINDYFNRERDADNVVQGIGDDGAILRNRSTLQVEVLDTLVEGVHFPEDTAPADIAWRSVAVNLSDIAAMGAQPLWMTLGLTLSDVDADWLEQFAAGLFAIADEYDVALVGGDTTQGPVTVVTVAMTGAAPEQPLYRHGAQVDDAIYVTGTVGDAAAGLLLGERATPYLRQRFLRPTPRVAAGQALVGHATAAIDVSDGLAADLYKMLAASDVGGELDINRLPLSAELQQSFPQDRCEELALTGGDDYELCFCGPEGLESVGATRIGTVQQQAGLRCRKEGQVVTVDTKGYRHFT